MSKRAMIPQYTLADVGCYVDGARGIYVVDRVVEIAEAHGMDMLKCDCDSCDVAPEHFTWSACEFSGEVEDDCGLFMNDTFPAEGACWGRNDNGDWGLWTIEEEGQ